MKELVERIRRLYPEPRIELDFKNPFELLVALILSARCTDTRTNAITKELFKKYPTPEALSKASIEDIDKLISSCSMHNTKSKHLKQISEIISQKYNGEVPDDVEELVKLPGVGRKTANILVSMAYNIPAVGVDTHVARVSKRLGITEARKPEDIERDIMNEIPKDEWIRFYTGLILHGRRVCKAKNPKCDECPLNDICPKIGVK